MSVFERVRLLSFGLLAVTFIAGALAGAAVDRAVNSDSRVESRERQEDNDRERSYIIDRVDMSEGQRATIDSILDLRVHRMRAVWREVGPRLDAITDSTRSEIMDVLTPEQREQYESMLKRRRDGGDNDDGFRGDEADDGSSAGTDGSHRHWRA
ncbi:MAG: hypothetical protein R6U63_14230 [Longimicrobiales bacterium]